MNSNYYSVPFLRNRRFHRSLFIIIIIFLFILSGCASPPYIYQPTEQYYVNQQIEFENSSPQIERGKDILILDGFNHYFISLLSKLILWNWKISDHRLPSENKAILEHYLKINKIESVKIRHNMYDPIGAFKRLTQNSEVGAGYRATIGFILWLRYTLFPDRIFSGLPIPFIGGGDHFNPYTNTINVYSSDIGILLHEAGHAKDYVQHEMKGTSFALFRILPGVDLIQEAYASSDAIRFLYCIDRPGDELRAYRTLIPAYSTYIAGYLYGGLIVTIPVVVSGHITGRIQAHRRKKEIMAEKNNEVTDIFHRRKFLPPCCKPFRFEPSEKH